MGCPLCVDQYNFSPAAVLEKVSIEQYLTFAVYCLEYRLRDCIIFLRDLFVNLVHFMCIKFSCARLTLCVYIVPCRSIVLEQLSEQREQEVLAKLAAIRSANEKDTPSVAGESTALCSALLEPYGVLANTCVIRDLCECTFAYSSPIGDG